MSRILEYLRARLVHDDLRLGRADGVETLFRQYAGQLFGYALSLSRRDADAEEAVQDVFTCLVRDPQLLAGVRNLKAYLYRAVRNRCLNRATVRNRELSLEETVWDFPSGEAAYEQIAIASAVDALPEEQREVVILKIHQGFTFREIAVLLDISQNTAASRYRYAIDRLRRHLLPDLELCAP